MIEIYLIRDKKKKSIPTPPLAPFPLFRVPRVTG
jgi:hypothetical protein